MPPALDFFVLYSSATTLFGNPGQSNYIAANSVLEALARLRRATGLTATCVRWGAIDDVGFLARSPKLKQALLDRMGGAALQSAVALEVLEAMLLSDRADLGVLELDWRAMRRFLPSASASKFIELARNAGHGETEEESAVDLERLLRELPEEELLSTVADMLKLEIGEILRIAPDKIDPARPMQEMGFDSLMGVELVVAVESRFGVRLPVLALSDSPTVTKLAAWIIKQLRSEGSERTLPDQGDATRAQIERIASQHAVEPAKRGGAGTHRDRATHRGARHSSPHDSMNRKTLPGLTARLKEKLIQQGLERRLQQANASSSPTRNLPPSSEGGSRIPEAGIPEEHYRFDLHPGYRQLRIIADGAARLDIGSPYFRVHEGIAGARIHIGSQEYLNFSSYNYLGLSGHPAVQGAAKAAIDRYGTSVSASRPVSGERALHRELEAEIAAAYGVDDAVAFVSGHATNVTTIGYLFGPRDLIIHDEFIHNSSLQGIQLSGARRLSFPHNDWTALDALLKQHRREFERALIVIEGIYSMDGDFPDLPRFVELKRRHQCFLMIDEAHSFGVMGTTGLGIREHFSLPGNAADIWMGTLSKTLAGCGGYIAGETALIEHLKFLAPGFLYSVGMPPPVAAASLAALRCLRREPQRVATLRERGALFLQLASASGIDTGFSTGLAVIPAIVGSSTRAARVSQALLQRRINVAPILYPAVPEKLARLRFFICCEHSESDIREAVSALTAELNR